MRRVLIHLGGLLMLALLALAIVGWAISDHRADQFSIASDKEVVSVANMADYMGIYIGIGDTALSGSTVGLEHDSHSPTGITTAIHDSNRWGNFGFEVNFADAPGGLTDFNIIWPQWFLALVCVFPAALYVRWLWRRRRRGAPITEPAPE